MGRDHWKSTPNVHFICLNLQKGVNTSFRQNHLQYRVITSIDTFLIYLWIIFLSCRYLQPIRIWRLLHEEYSFTLSLSQKKILTNELQSNFLDITKKQNKYEERFWSTWWTKYLDSYSVIVFLLFINSQRLPCLVIFTWVHWSTYIFAQKIFP